MGLPASQLITASKEQLKRAGEETTHGWQSFSALLPDGNPAEVVHVPVFVSKIFRDLDVRHGWAPGEAMDPRAAALKVAKAGRAGPGDFRPPVGR